MRRLVLVVLLAMGVCAGDAQAQDRYSLVGGCYALKSAATGKFVAKTAGGGYRATAGGAGGAEPLRMQATDLGRYLLYGAKRDFVGVGKPLPLPVPSPTSPIPVPDLPVATTTQTGDRVQSARVSERDRRLAREPGGRRLRDRPAGGPRAGAHRRGRRHGDHARPRRGRHARALGVRAARRLPGLSGDPA